MRVYIDTGLFIDYLSARTVVATRLRSTGRRDRTRDQVLSDAERVLTRVERRHEGATSALTYYEVEEALYKSLRAGTTGVSNVDVYRVNAARSIVPQTVIAVTFFNIEVLELTPEIVDAQLRIVELQTGAFARPMHYILRPPHDGTPMWC
jgi:hypothetical protein